MTEAALDRRATGGTMNASAILWAITFCHFLNDLSTSLLPAIYPVLKSGLDLSFGQIGLLTLVYQGVASMLQPVVGLFTDRRPQAYSLPFGMACTLFGLTIVAFAPAFLVVLAGGGLIGIGSAIFHPESSRIARLASKGAHGFAQSLFQVGGNFGNSIAPLAAAFFVLPHGRDSLAWFALVALAGIFILAAIGRWYQNSGHSKKPARHSPMLADGLSASHVRRAIVVLIALIFSKFFYLSSITSYYIFYLMHRFDMTTQRAQLCLFVFLAASAAGTFIGGPVGDRFGRKNVIWGSILGVLPFTLVLPYVGLTATIVLSIVIGLIISSAFSAIVVYAQELMPGRVGMVAGLFFGLAFGMAGTGAAVLGQLIDYTSIDFVYHVCSFLPLIGLLTAFLPNVRVAKTAHA